jgi:hypothetical protein
MILLKAAAFFTKVFLPALLFRIIAEANQPASTAASSLT